MVVGARALPRGGRLRADLTLLAVAIVWGSAFVAQRVAAAHLGSFLYNGLRFLLGALVLFPILRLGSGQVLRRPKGLGRKQAWARSGQVLRRRRRAISRTEWRGGTLAGLLLLGASALQQAGLQFTTAGKAGFVTGLYVVLVPLFLALGWRQWPSPPVWAASLLAVTGLFLLSAEGLVLSDAEGQIVLAPGDGLELAGAVLWALHVILIGRLAARVDPLRLAAVQYLTCGVLSTSLGLGLEADTLAGLPVAWWPVIYGGVISVGLGYTLQAIGQREAPASDAALILSVEAVFAALFGWLFLREALALRQLLGCGLMLGGMLLAQLPTLDRGPS